MTLPESHLLPYIAFIVFAAIEQYFFMMQRSALEISRAQGIDEPVGRLMLPLWYILVWPVKGGKWAGAIFVGLQDSWLVAGLLLVVAFVFSIFVPIPHRQFIPMFGRKLSKEMGNAINSGASQESKLYAELFSKLNEASKDPRFN